MEPTVESKVLLLPELLEHIFKYTDPPTLLQITILHSLPGFLASCLLLTSPGIGLTDPDVWPKRLTSSSSNPADLSSVNICELAEYVGMEKKAWDTVVLLEVFAI